LEVNYEKASPFVLLKLLESHESNILNNTLNNMNYGEASSGIA